MVEAAGEGPGRPQGAKVNANAALDSNKQPADVSSLTFEEATVLQLLSGHHELVSRGSRIFKRSNQTWQQKAALDNTGERNV